MKAKSIRVLIVDDIPQVREGLKTVLKLAAKHTLPEIEVIGEAQNGNEAIQQTALLRPEVILMDLELPIMDGYEATRQIKANQAETRVIILSIHAGLKEKQLALSAGADDFISKDCSIETLMNAILTTKISNCP